MKFIYLIFIRGPVREKDTMEDIRDKVAMKLNEQLHQQFSSHRSQTPSKGTDDRSPPKVGTDGRLTPRGTDGRTTPTLASKPSRSESDKSKGALEPNSSRNARGEDIALKTAGGRSLTNDSKALVDADIKSGDTLRFAQRPHDWKHRTVSIKFKVEKPTVDHWRGKKKKA